MGKFYDKEFKIEAVWLALEPGDVVTKSTPPAPSISPEDTIEAEIEGIGVLRNL